MQSSVRTQRTAQKAGQSGTKYSITALDHPQKDRGITDASYWYFVVRNGPAKREAGQDKSQAIMNMKARL